MGELAGYASLRDESTGIEVSPQIVEVSECPLIFKCLRLAHAIGYGSPIV